MSRLKLFSPNESELADRFSFETDEPVVIPFHRTCTTSLPTTVEQQSRQLMDSVLRARTIHSNRICPYCDYPIVEPIELKDATLNRNRQPIPGTGTLVGFRCQRCDTEWPV